MKALFKGIFSFILLVSFVVAGVFFLDKKNFFALNELQLEFDNDASMVNQEAFKIWTGELSRALEDVKGTSLWKLPLKKINNNVMDHAWVGNVQIRRQFPTSLKLSIHAKKWLAVVLWQHKMNIVSNDCSILPAISPKVSPNLPILRGQEFLQNEELRGKACETLKSLPANGLLSLESVSEVNKDKLGIYLSLGNSQTKIRLGDEPNVLQVARVQKVLEYLEEKGMKAQNITASFKSKVVVKLIK